MEYRVFCIWLLLTSLSHQPAKAQLRPAIETPGEQQARTVLVSVHPEIKPKPEHYIGYGWKRSKHLIAFPVLHPVKFADKASFPLRHPILFSEDFGNAVQPHQNTASFISSLSGPLSAIGIFTRLNH